MKNNGKNYQSKKQSNIIVVAVTILAGCGFINYAWGMANPAAVYCNELGYQYTVEETVDGQQGFCQLPDGSFVDGWEFFIGEEGKEYSYCQQQGFEIKTIISEQCQYTSKCAVCVLKNGKETRVVELMGLDSKSTLLPWDPTKPTNGEIEEPITLRTNYLFYFVGIMVLVISLIVVFIIYKKMKNRNDYYQ